MGQVVRGGEQFETAIAADFRGAILKRGPDSGEVDAFGRHRVSEPFTLFDSTLRYSKRTDLWFEKATGSATFTYSVNESALDIGIGTASGNVGLRRTKRRFPYQPGKSLMVLQSFVPATPAAGVKQDVGLFDDENGVMFRINGTTAQFVIRSKASGSVVENVIDQDSWNIDTFEALDLTKVQIFIADMEWLGSGRVRCGFVIDGEIHYCHEFNQANNGTTVYCTTAILPLSYRIESTAIIASGASLKQICSSVMSEGGYEPSGAVYIVGRGASGVGSISSEEVVAGIRMASGREGNVISPSQVDATIEGNTTAQWRLRLNPTITSGTWTAADNGRGNVEVLTAATISGGTVIAAGIVGSRGSASLPTKSALELSLGVNANGDSDVIVLTLEADSSTKGTGLLGWRELV